MTLREVLTIHVQRTSKKKFQAPISRTQADKRSGQQVSLSRKWLQVSHKASLILQWDLSDQASRGSVTAAKLRSNKIRGFRLNWKQCGMHLSNPGIQAVAQSLNLGNSKHSGLDPWDVNCTVHFIYYSLNKMNLHLETNQKCYRWIARRKAVKWNNRNTNTSKPKTPVILQQLNKKITGSTCARTI